MLSEVSGMIRPGNALQHPLVINLTYYLETHGYKSNGGAWMSNKLGIIDREWNPFSCGDWVNQGFGMTDHRRKQLKDILGKSIEEIRELDRNEGSYPAFVAIRWGFAEVKDNRLVATPKLSRAVHYDRYGASLASMGDV